LDQADPLTAYVKTWHTVLQSAKAGKRKSKKSEKNEKNFVYPIAILNLCDTILGVQLF